MHGHSFERIWTKFGTWHLYTLRMVMGWLASATREHRSRLQACAPRAVVTPLQITADRKHLTNGAQNYSADGRTEIWN